MSTLNEAVQRFKILKQKLKSLNCYNKQQNTIKSTHHQQAYRYSIQKQQKQYEGKQLSKQHELIRKQRKKSQNRGCLKNIPDPNISQKYQFFEQSKQNIMKNINKKNNKSLINKKCDKQRQKTIIFEANQQDKTEKKSVHKMKHKKNNSCTLDVFKSKSTTLQRDKKNNSQKEEQVKSLKNSRSFQFEKELNEKGKLLNSINDLLEKKRNILQDIDKKIEHERFCEKQFMNTSLESFASREMVSRKKIRAPNLYQMQMEARKRGQSKSMKIRWKS